MPEELSIATDPTALLDHSTASNDPLASQRAELLGQIVAAEFDLERVVRELSGSGADLARDQLRALGQLQRAIGKAGLADIAILRREIGSAIALTHIAIEQSRSAGGATIAAEIDAAAEAAATARRTVNQFITDFYERKIFDPYLRFSSPDDEAQYRKRETGFRTAIDAARAKGTPEGDREAANLALAQLRDAGAHGANRSPDYAPSLAKLEGAETGFVDANKMPPAKPNIPSISLPPATAASDKSMDDVMGVLAAVGVTTDTKPSTDQGHGLGDRVTMPNAKAQVRR